MTLVSGQWERRKVLCIMIAAGNNLRPGSLRGSRNTLRLIRTTTDVVGVRRSGGGHRRGGSRRNDPNPIAYIWRNAAWFSLSGFFLSETSFVCATENWQVLQVSWVFVTSFNTFKMLQDGSSYSLRTISLSPRPSSGNSRPLGRSRNQKPHIICQ
jgi:hypothetical protein